eukprot:TRINITY_DN170_c0_g2_i2.p1 TRINITY_DN170_c0_g2~~TRINITY_DN170_c0_g2_i2.p1  ORF type:complete len:119 (-),score=5.69 TRINITY_DN170_c0_g2_i2:170-526(-)
MVGIMNYVLLWSVNMMCCGIFLKKDQLFWPLRCLYYVDIVKLGFDLYITITFEDSTYPECTGGPPGCFGHNGKEILKSISSIYGPINLDSNVKTNSCCALLGIGVFFWVCTYTTLTKG